MTITERVQKVLAEIDAKLAQWEREVTAGPWRNKHHQNTSEIFSDEWGPIAQMHSSPAPIQERNNTSDFIVTSRTLLPNLANGIKKGLAGLQRAKINLESYYIDWDKMRRGSPDYDPEYTPSFGIDVEDVNASIDALCDQWDACNARA
jgi:hypothetical protein